MKKHIRPWSLIIVMTTVLVVSGFAYAVGESVSIDRYQIRQVDDSELSVIKRCDLSIVCLVYEPNGTQKMTMSCVQSNKLVSAYCGE